MSSFQLQNSEVLARLKPFGISFERSLSDLIKGIRSHSKESPESLSTFLDNAIMECKNELVTTDLEVKAMAILKLAYLEMYGFDMSWCNFQILEVMSSSKFQQKRIGYLAAIQSFKSEQDLLILATNQFKKDLNSHLPAEIGLALSGIATIVTPNLAKDINDDVLSKFKHSEPYIRKKAILAMYKIFLQYPESLRMNFIRIIEQLDDPDIAVISATINVICEISKKNPRIFINYLPKFFIILAETNNNWLIIRILKLFQSLSRVEPRLKKKIMPTLMDLMMSTKASSLVYECINCIVNGHMLSSTSSKDRDTAIISIERIMRFFEMNDSNLKFVGLLAFINILKVFPNLIHSVKGVSNIIMECLNDPDLIIKRKALEVCQYMVSEDNIADIVKVLLLQLVSQDSDDNIVPDYLKAEIVSKILEMASKDNFVNIPNFKWYVAVLKDIVNLTLLDPSSQINGVDSSASLDLISSEVGKEFKALATRVPSTRNNIMNNVVYVYVQDISVINNCPYLLQDLYWVMGEYIDQLGLREEDESEVSYYNSSGSSMKEQLLTCLTNAPIDFSLDLKSNFNFPVSRKLMVLPIPDVLIVSIQAIVKIYSSIVSDYFQRAVSDKLPKETLELLAYKLHRVVKFFGNWTDHPSFEVQERVTSWLEFLNICLEVLVSENFEILSKLEAQELNVFETLANESIKYTDSNMRSDHIENTASITDYDYESDGSPRNRSSSDSGSIIGRNESIRCNDLHQNKKAKEIELNQQLHANDSKSANPEVLKPVPMLLTNVLPSFFKSYPLNPVSKKAQHKIAIPENLDLDTWINPPQLVEDSDIDEDEDDPYGEDILANDSYIESNRSPDAESDFKRERLERLKDDPFYITSNESTTKGKSTTPEDHISTPHTKSFESIGRGENKKKRSETRKLKKEKVVILGDETVDGDALSDSETKVKEPNMKLKSKRPNAFKIDSSNLDNFDLESPEVSENLNSLDGKDNIIDLDGLRKMLAETSSKKSNSKKKSKKSDDITNLTKKSAESKKKSKKKKSRGENSEHNKTLENSNIMIDLPMLDNDVEKETKEIPTLKKGKKKTKARIIE